MFTWVTDKERCMACLSDIDVPIDKWKYTAGQKSFWTWLPSRSDPMICYRLVFVSDEVSKTDGDASTDSAVTFNPDPLSKLYSISKYDPTRASRTYRRWALLAAVILLLFLAAFLLLTFLLKQ